jgi:CheY-like chemotaxis protein
MWASVAEHGLIGRIPPATKSGGIGTGMPVTGAIVERHEGRHCRTPNDGPGAIALVCLSVQPSDRERRGAHTEGFLMGKPSLVAVVDDSESVRESLADLLRHMGFVVHAFSSAEEFLGSDVVSETACLILDVALPGISGPDLQENLTLRGQAIPIIFITAQGDASLGPRLLARGATAYLAKPFSDSALLEAVAAALGTR